MKVAIVAETFLPEINGVTNSVRRVVEHLRRGGHKVLVIAPAPGPCRYGDVDVERVAGLTLPFYPSLSVGVSRRDRMIAVLRNFDPDVVHLAAPFVLGACGIHAARALGIPSIAVFQTDIARFATRYRLSSAAPTIWRWVRHIHQAAELTLAPSTHSMWELRRRGVERIALWGRGVDLEQFAPGHRSEALRREWGCGGDTTAVGYVGRLANEKRVSLLGAIDGLTGTRLVVVGDGPARSALRGQLPMAHFTGMLHGAELGSAVASLDVFVHTGAAETFCQAIQESLAAGVAVVAPAVGGPVDLVRHGENGFLYPPDDPGLLRGAVETLVRDPVTRGAMGARGRASVLDRTWERIGDELLGHYHSVLRPTARLARAS
jgi:phosphatidylinositol alpha 1,6-mannosyltransferase